MRSRRSSARRSRTPARSTGAPTSRSCSSAATSTCRELVSQIHGIKRRFTPSGNVSFDAERTGRGHADRFWAIVIACQKERGPSRRAEAEVGVRVIG